MVEFVINKNKQEKIGVLFKFFQVQCEDGSDWMLRMFNAYFSAYNDNDNNNNTLYHFRKRPLSNLTQTGS